MVKKAILFVLMLASFELFSAGILHFTPRDMVVENSVPEELLKKFYLKQFISISGPALKISHCGTGVKMFCGGAFESGRQMLTFLAKSSGVEAVKLDVSISIYPGHFREDICAGSASVQPVMKKSFTITGNTLSKYTFSFDVTPEMLLCSLDDHQLPANRFFIRIIHGGKDGQQLEIRDINLHTSGNFRIWGKKEIIGSKWLEDELLKDSRKIRKKDVQEHKTAVSVFPEKTEIAAGKKCSPQVVQKEKDSVSLKSVIRSIQCDMPALLNARWQNDRLVIEAMPTGGEPFIDIYLDLPDKTRWWYMHCSKNHEGFSITNYDSNLKCFGSSWYSGVILKLDPGTSKVRIKSCFFKEKKSFVIEKITINREVEK